MNVYRPQMAACIKVILIFLHLFSQCLVGTSDEIELIITIMVLYMTYYIFKNDVI